MDGMAQHDQEKTQTLKLLPQEEEKRMEDVFSSQLFKGLTEGMISVLPQDDDKESAWIPGGHGEQGRAGKLVAKEQENISAAGRYQRE